MGNYERNLLHRHVVPNYTNSQLRAGLSASQHSTYTFYEIEQLRTEFSASWRSAKFIYFFIFLFLIFSERLWTEFTASSRNAKSHYILRNIHGF